MDVAGVELSQVLRSLLLTQRSAFDGSNRLETRCQSPCVSPLFPPPITPSRVGSTNPSENLGATNETSLHCLLAAHVPVEEIEKVLEQLPTKRITREIHSSSMLDATVSRGVTALHLAIYRNAWKLDRVLELLLQACPKLAQMSMSTCESTPLHIMLGQNVTIQSQALATLLRYTPQRMLMQPDIHGDTPLSCLWKNVMRFRWAQRWEIDGEVPEELLLESEHGNCKSTSWSSSSRTPLSCMTIVTPQQYWDFSHLLLTTYFGRSTLTIHDLCGVPSLPPLLLRFYLYKLSGLSKSATGPDALPSKFPLSLFQSRDQQGRTPLHWAASTVAVNTRFLPKSVAIRHASVLELIVAQAPASVAIPDRYGRWPLHYAALGPTQQPQPSNDNTLLDIRFLLNAYPDALNVVDPVTGLYAVQLLATNPLLFHDSVSVLSPERATKHLNFLYALICWDPNVLGVSRAALAVDSIHPAAA